MMQDKEQKGWYKITIAIHEGLFQAITKDMSNGGQIRPQNMILIKQTFSLIQLYKDCYFVGFTYEDKEAEEIISNLMSEVTSTSSSSIEIPDNPFYDLYFGLCCLERVLELIKEEYTTNINVSIKHLEDVIYRSNDFQNLIEVSRNIGRKLINQDLHSDFSILKKHISEQMEYLERSKKHVLPPQTLSIQPASTVEESEQKETINLTHREIATLCYLNDFKDLTYSQAEELALFYGQKSRTSGKKLKEQYWKVFVKEEGMNHKYNAEIYTHSNSYQSILKIIPLLEKEENIKLAKEYLKKSEPYKDVKSRE
jgi:hypothetical protein